MSASSSPTFSPGNAITAIDFRRGEKGDGQVIINFADSSADVDMSEVGGNLQLVIDKAALPESLRQRLDVVDFATPVQRVDSYMLDGKATVVIRPKGNFDYLAYQADNQFTISVEEVSEEDEENRRRDKFPYSCLLYTSPSPRDKRQSRMPSSA